MRYSLNAIAEFEELTGKTYLEIFSPEEDSQGNVIERKNPNYDPKKPDVYKDEDGVEIRNLETIPINTKLGGSVLRAMLYVGLKHEDPELTIEGAGELTDSFTDIFYVQMKITEAMSRDSHG
ncbi:MAG: hypothetical protein WCE94_15235, partial [Candidatus Methanoperedens sp.]